MNNYLYILILFFWTSPKCNSINNYAHRFLLNKKLKLIIMTTPKAASSSILNVFLNLTNQNTEHQNYPTPHHYFFESYYYNNTITEEIFFDSSYYKIKFVRCPYKRVVSAYLQHIKKNRTEFKLSFEEFLILLKNQDWGKFRFSTILQNSIIVHSQLQYTPFDKYMDIIKIEDPQAELNKLYLITGISLNLKTLQLNKTNYIQEKTYQYAGSSTPEDNEQISPYYTFYSKYTLKLVEEIYKKDIKTFNYSCPKEIIDFIRDDT